MVTSQGWEKFIGNSLMYMTHNYAQEHPQTHAMELCGQKTTRGLDWKGKRSSGPLQFTTTHQEGS